MGEIGYRIKSIRKEKRLNQSEFAKSIEISQGNLSEIEKGNSNPSAETMISIRNKYNVDLNWLLTGDSDQGDTYEDYYEKKLVEIFSDLNNYDKDEIIEIMLLKTRLRNKQD